MTQKYKLIVLLNNPAALSNIELAQRVAFSYGYNWPLNDTTITETDNDILFDPNQKTIRILNYNPQLFPNFSVVKEIAGLNDKFKKPDLDAVIIKSKDGSTVAEITETSVRFCRGYTIDVPKELLDQICNSKTEGDDIPLPTVYFRYNHVDRHVEVTKMDADYIQGFEIMRNGVETGRSFKKFCVDKVQSEVALETFRPLGSCRTPA